MWCGQLQAGYTCGWADWLVGELNSHKPLKSTETNTIDVAKHNMLWHSFSINVRMWDAEKQIAHTCLTSVPEASQLQRLRGMLSRLMASLYNSIQLTKSRGCALLPEIHESRFELTDFSHDTVVCLARLFGLVSHWITWIREVKSWLLSFATPVTFLPLLCALIFCWNMIYWKLLRRRRGY